MQRIIFFALLTLSLILSQESSLAFETRGQDCSKCHTLNQNEAGELLKDLFPNVKVHEIRVSPSKGFWELYSEAGGRKGLIYIDFAKKYAFMGSLLSIKDRRNLTQERLAELNKIDVAQIPLGDALVMGDANAKHKVIVFDDPDWPYCAKLHQEMKKITEERKDIAFYVKMSPLRSHTAAFDKAKAIICEKSLKLLDDAHAKKPLPKPACETNAVEENVRLTEKLGFTGVPVTVLPDGRVIQGYREANVLIQMITGN